MMKGPYTKSPTMKLYYMAIVHMANDEGYYMAIVHTDNEIDRMWGCCYNCGKEGHQWRDCTELLKELLREEKEWLDWKNKANLNRDGGAGMKGGCPPQVAITKALPHKGHTAKGKN